MLINWLIITIRCFLVFTLNIFFFVSFLFNFLFQFIYFLLICSFWTQYLLLVKICLLVFLLSLSVFYGKHLTTFTDIESSTYSFIYAELRVILSQERLPKSLVLIGNLDVGLMRKLII